MRSGPRAPAVAAGWSGLYPPPLPNYSSSPPCAHALFFQQNSGGLAGPHRQRVFLVAEHQHQWVAQWCARPLRRIFHAGYAAHFQQLKSHLGVFEAADGASFAHTQVFGGAPGGGTDSSRLRESDGIATQETKEAILFRKNTNKGTLHKSFLASLVFLEPATIISLRTSARAAASPAFGHAPKGCIVLIFSDNFPN